MTFSSAVGQPGSAREPLLIRLRAEFRAAAFSAAAQQTQVVGPNLAGRQRR